MKLKRYHLLLISILGGVILSLGWPARGFIPLLFIGMVPFLFIEDHISRDKQRFGRLSVFLLTYPGFLTWNLLTTWWIWNASEVGAILAFLLNSLFMALVFHLYHLAKINRSSGSLYFILVFFWITFEYMHHNWDGTWPWLSLGNGLATYIKWIQWYEFTGIFGGTLWILSVNILVYQFLKTLADREKPILSSVARGLYALLLFIVPVIISVSMFNRYEEKENPVDIIVIQPNMDPYTQQFTVKPLDVVDTNINLALRLLDEDVEYLVSPESAIQERIWMNYISQSISLQKLQNFTEEHPGLQFVIGASTFYEFGDGEELTPTARKFRDGDGWYEAFNTAVCIDYTGDIQTYHKSKLTPGVEKMPYPELFKPLENLAINLGGTVGSLGVEPARKVFTRERDSLAVAPVICYESVFGEFLTGYIRKGANLIFVITNDGWWGDTPGYRQHFTYSQIRAIETRRSVARSANTGKSAFINQRGEVFQPTAYWVPAVIRQKINANDEITFYVVWGDYIARVSAFVSIFILLIAISNRLRRRSIRGKR
jgi:apolipoprotein N-acyltransferase